MNSDGEIIKESHLKTKNLLHLNEANLVDLVIPTFNAHITQHF